MNGRAVVGKTPAIDPLHKWRLDLNNNTLYILSLIIMFHWRQKIFLMDVRLRMYKYCYSNKGAIYAKGLYNNLYCLCIGYFRLSFSPDDCTAYLWHSCPIEFSVGLPVLGVWKTPDHPSSAKFLWIITITSKAKSTHNLSHQIAFELKQVQSVFTDFTVWQKFRWEVDLPARIIARVWRVECRVTRCLKVQGFLEITFYN